MKSQRKTGALDPARAQRIKDALEAALRDGFDPFRDARGGKGSCVPEAARRLTETGYETTERMVRGLSCRSWWFYAALDHRAWGARQG